MVRKGGERPASYENIAGGEMRAEGNGRNAGSLQDGHCEQVWSVAFEPLLRKPAPILNLAGRPAEMAPSVRGARTLRWPWEGLD